MVRSDYPLRALRELRDERVDALARRLAEKVACTLQAAERVREHERARHEHAERVAAAVAAEQTRLAAGRASSAELLRVVDYQGAAREQARLLERAEREARQELATAQAEEQKAREEHRQREAEAKLVRNHEAGFHERRVEHLTKAEEEAALEQWNARRR